MLFPEEDLSCAVGTILEELYRSLERLEAAGISNREPLASDESGLFCTLFWFDLLSCVHQDESKMV